MQYFVNSINYKVGFVLYLYFLAAITVCYKTVDKELPLYFMFTLREIDDIKKDEIKSAAWSTGVLAAATVMGSRFVKAGNRSGVKHLSRFCPFGYSGEVDGVSSDKKSSNAYTSLTSQFGQRIKRLNAVNSIQVLPVNF